MTMALKHGMKDQQRSPPSCLFLYLNRTTEKENVFVVKCTRESQQALEIYNSIEKAVMTYGPNRSKVMIGQWPKVQIFFCLRISFQSYVLLCSIICCSIVGLSITYYESAFKFTSFSQWFEIY